MSCPSCPDDFNVKNIPDEVECLVTNKVGNSRAGELVDASGFIDVSNSGINLLAIDVPFGKDSSTGANLTDASLVDGYSGDVTINGNTAKRGDVFQSASGNIYISLKP